MCLQLFARVACVRTRARSMLALFAVVAETHAEKPAATGNEDCARAACLCVEIDNGIDTGAVRARRVHTGLMSSLSYLPPVRSHFPNHLTSMR